MNISTLISRRSLVREALGKAALRAVCACQYYDLADSLQETSIRELVNIINGNYDCPMCGQKGAN